MDLGFFGSWQTMQDLEATTATTPRDVNNMLPAAFFQDVSHDLVLVPTSSTSQNMRRGRCKKGPDVGCGKLRRLTDLPTKVSHDGSMGLVIPTWKVDFFNGKCGEIYRSHGSHGYFEEWKDHGQGNSLTSTMPWRSGVSTVFPIKSEGVGTTNIKKTRVTRLGFQVFKDYWVGTMTTAMFCHKSISDVEWPNKIGWKMLEK